VKFAFAVGVNLLAERLEVAFVSPPRSLMKIAVNDDLVSGGFQLTQPGDELSILHGRALAVVIGHDKKRTTAHALPREFDHDLRDDRSRRRCNVMDRNDEEILSGTAGRDDRQILRCRQRTHPAANFGALVALNKAKGGSRPPGAMLTKCRPLAGWIYHRARRARSTYSLISTIRRKSAALSGMTDSRDCRTSAMPLRRGSALICRSVTARDNALIGARSTALQSPSRAVGS